MPAEPPSSDAAGKVVDLSGQEGSPRPRDAGTTADGGSVVDRGGQESSQLWHAVAALGRSQDGVFGVAQLRALGCSDRQLTWAVARGRLVRRHRGVYADALTRPTSRARLLAALLALGPEAFLSRRTALALYGVRALNLREIEATVVSEHTPRHAGMTVHRTTVEPLADELRTRDGLRCSSPSLALLEVAARETPAELDRLVAELARRRLLDLERVEVAIERRRGLRGLAKLRAAFRRYRPQTAADVSGFERDFAAWLATQPDIPAPQRNVRLGDGRWEVDFLWPAQRLVVETDGDQYHRTPGELERDRVKDAWLQCQRLRVLRVTDFRFAHDRTGISCDIAAMLQAA